eukprot:2027065-Rhodomonas_salina.1
MCRSYAREREREKSRKKNNSRAREREGGRKKGTGGEDVGCDLGHGEVEEQPSRVARLGLSEAGFQGAPRAPARSIADSTPRARPVLVDKHGEEGVGEGGVGHEVGVEARGRCV